MIKTATSLPGRASGLLSILAGGLALGSSGVFARLSETAPAATEFWRAILALPLFGLWILLSAANSGSAREPPYAQLLAALRDPRLLCAGVFFAGDIVLWNYSLLLTSIAAATLEANLAPLLITLFAWFAWRARPAKQSVAGMILALIGLMLVVAPNLAHRDSAFRGDLIGISAAGFYAAYIIVIARLRAIYDAPVVMFLTTLAFALVLLPLAAVHNFVPTSSRGWMLLAGLAAIAQFAGQGLIAYGLAHLPATLGSIGLYMQPIAASVYAWGFLGERLLPSQILGGLITICAIGIATSARSHAQDPSVVREQPIATAQRVRAGKSQI